MEINFQKNFVLVKISLLKLPTLSVREIRQTDRDLRDEFHLFSWNGNLQSYWTTTELWKLTVVLDYYEAMETYSRIGLLRAVVFNLAVCLQKRLS